MVSKKFSDKNLVQQKKLQLTFFLNYKICKNHFFDVIFKERSNFLLFFYLKHLNI